MHNQRFHIIPAGCAVLLRIEGIRVLGQVCLYALAVRVAQLCSIIHLADAKAGSLFHILVRDAGCAVQYDRNGNAFPGLLQDIELQLRNAFIEAVRVSDAQCKRIYTCQFRELLCFRRVGIGPVSYTHLDVYKRQAMKCF